MATSLIGAFTVGDVQARTEPLSATDAKNPDEQIKCRKVEVTGSLVKKGKVCRTIAEWRRIQQNGNDTARIMLGEQICTGGECRGN
jgi:hypothetical protein